MGTRGKPVCFRSPYFSDDILTIITRTAAAEVLNDYIESVGGREALAKVPRPGKKRGRKSTASTNGTPIAQDPDKRNGKRARKLESEDPQDTESPGPSKPRIPPGNWEDLIGSIDTMEKQVGGLYILLTFKDGNRIKQPASVVYKRCPQKVWVYKKLNRI